MKKIIIGNWKMNKTISEEISFLEDFFAVWDTEEKNNNSYLVGIAPSFLSLPYLTKFQDTKGKNFVLVAQNSSYKNHGALTGEISPKALKEIGVKWVLVGHSERRNYFGETDETVNEKILFLLKNGFVPVVCVGEDYVTYKENASRIFIQKQLRTCLKGVFEQAQPQFFVIAYEPRWAIGTGLVPTLNEIKDIQETIRKEIIMLAKNTSKIMTFRVLYGGSVNQKNSQEILSKTGVDGLLVGNASLELTSFSALFKKNT